MAALEARELSIPDLIADQLIKLRLFSDTTKAPILQKRVNTAF